MAGNLHALEKVEEIIAGSNSTEGHVLQSLTQMQQMAANTHLASV